MDNARKIYVGGRTPTNESANPLPSTIGESTEQAVYNWLTKNFPNAIPEGGRENLAHLAGWGVGMTPLNLVEGAQKGARYVQSGDPSDFVEAMAAPLAVVPGANIEKTAAETGEKGIAEMLAKKAVSKPEGIIAYHGSPYTFEKFDPVKIGTGEGAQAYGHGLYFAEAEPTAQSYRPKGLTYEGKPASSSWNTAGLDYVDPKVFQQTLGRAAIDDAIARLKEQSAFYDTVYGGGRGDPNLYSHAAEILQGLDPSKIKQAGATYQVRINVDPTQMLDWDKPLSEQSPSVVASLRKAGAIGSPTPENEVRSMVDKVMRERGLDEGPAIQHVYDDVNKRLSAALDSGNDAEHDRLTDLDYAIRQWWDSGTLGRGQTGMDPSGGSILQEFERSLAGKTNIMGERRPADASDALRQAGVPGIKYLDQGSRDAGGGTSNYVVFDPNTIEILKRYGLAGLGGAVGAGALMNASDGGPQSATAGPLDQQQRPQPFGSSPEYDDWWRRLQDQRFAGG